MEIERYPPASMSAPRTSTTRPTTATGVSIPTHASSSSRAPTLAV